MRLKVAYIMSRFPQLSETFILREMIELENRDVEVTLYPLIFQSQAIVHPEAQGWISRAHRLPWISKDSFLANWRQFTTYPKRYTRLFWDVFSGNFPSPKFLIRALSVFPKVVYMAELMRAEHVSHIHAHYATHPALAAWMIHKLTGISYSVTVHAHDIYVDRTMLAPKIRDAAFVVAISEFNRQFLGKHLGEWVLHKCHVVHCGIQPDRYRPARGKSSTCFEIVSIGSLQPYKGQRYLVDACAFLRQRGVNFRCRIIGGGELHSELEKLIAARNLQGYVILAGSHTQDSVAAMLGEADCYVQPSIITPLGKMEGIPVALMEAMACNLPVVATDISGIPELVRHGETGWLVPEKDPVALANAMEFINSHTDVAQTLAKAGRKLVLESFDLVDNIAMLSLLLNRNARSIMARDRT
jgi:colanic acid/amylovoran biosynthesis glycosyltransferase